MISEDQINVNNVWARNQISNLTQISCLHLICFVYIFYFNVEISMEKVWFPEKLFINTDKIEENYAIVVLNRPILNDKNQICSLWKNGKNECLQILCLFQFRVISATLRVTVDGGTDRWMTFLTENNLSNKLKPE